LQKLYLILYLLTFVFTGIGAWIISRFGLIWGFVDPPNERSSHSRPTPKGGGVGILAAFVFASLFIQIPFTLWIPTTFIALLSLFGDKLNFSPKIRLPFQFIAAFVFLVGMEYFQINELISLLLLISFTVFIVGTANFYNFMDGINGIAAITGIVGFGLLALSNFLSEGDMSFTILSACIALSCLGFLPFNMPNAKVFMGDVGSVLLGFVFAGMVVMLSKNFLDFICFSSFLFPFYADELTTMAVRLRDGQNLLQPHRRHLYQLLANEKGISHWIISVGYGLGQFLVGITVFLVKPFGIMIVLLLLAAYLGGFILLTFRFRKSIGLLAGAEYR